MRHLHLVLMVTVAHGLVGCASPKAGDKAPSLAGLMLAENDGTRPLTAVTGRPLLIDFWATW